MKVYKFGKESTVCYNIIILEDDGEIKIAFVGTKNVKEYIAKPVKYKTGITRLIYGDGSSMPYKGTDGTLCERYVLIYEE